MKPEKHPQEYETRAINHSVLKILEKTESNRGFLAEKKFFNAIKNANGSAPHWYKDISKTERKMDRKGIDFIIYTSYGKVYVQTKSSDSGAKKFLKQLKTRRSRYKIIVLVIKIEYGEEEIRNISFPAMEKEIELFRKPFCP